MGDKFLIIKFIYAHLRDEYSLIESIARISKYISKYPNAYDLVSSDLFSLNNANEYEKKSYIHVNI